MADTKTSERLTKVETIVARHEELLRSQISKNEDIAVLRTLMERQDQRDEKQSEQLETFEITMKNVNENLSNLNYTQQQMKDNLIEIGTRVEKVEKVQKDNKEKNTIDLNGMSKKTILWTITSVGTVIVAAVVLYVQIKLGLK